MAINRKFIREHTPNVPWLRRILTSIRLKAYENDLINWNTVQSCIQDPHEKAKTIEHYCGKWPERAAQVKKEASEFGIDSSMFQDVLFANFAYGMRAEEFMYYDFADKTELERSTFLSDKKYSEFTVRMNNLFDADTFYNKANSYKVMKKYYQRDALVLTGSTPISEIEAFIKEHPVFVKKIGKSSLGKGVSKVDLSERTYQGRGTPSIERLVREWLSEGEDLLLEELVVQSSFMSEFNPSSVNTIRVISFVTKSGIITPYTFLKTGKGGSFVDNGGAGGILIGIDSKTGELITDGIDEKRNMYVVHPDTGKKYKGTFLPDWSQAIDLCKKMALELPSVKMVGWDLAHTEKGWVLIEANERSQIVGPQLIFNRGLRQELLDIMNQMDLYIPY